MDSVDSSNPTKFMCRVCGEAGHYDLWEMKFRCNDTDVMLIEAFNSFSSLSNESAEIYLCELCTESLTLAYSFWQQVKESDEKFMKESEKKEEQQNETEAEENRMIEFVDIVPEQLSKTDSLSTPVKRKIRKTKPKPSESPDTNEKKIGVNIALPHFVIANAEFDEHETQDTIENGIKNGDGDSQSDSESYRKKIKTLKPSAVIPPDLDKINELCMSPMEIDGDTQSIYKCSHCPKAFAAPHHLMIHMRKSHMCQYCLATFAKINDLYSHVKEMHKTFDCLLCSKEFQSNGNLRQHMRKNHSIFLPAHISLLNISDLNQ
ncbi:zinc finger protein 423-like [Sitodiplosis mosellana]|uniref:zinc finger protein 423-like n=1 Tax=Sitodiplosis mosellana TaxID=263140 RepID=UPI0024447CDE|nr:zinc finger protein 423-like [Sitodiplosis mosellana]